jgi:hypothetical protein
MCVSLGYTSFELYTKSQMRLYGFKGELKTDDLVLSSELTLCM